MKRRVFSFVTALALCLNLCPAWALAAEDTADATLCPHHPAHTDACGYTAPAEGQPCGHEYTEECYTEQTQCIHVHDESCYSDVVLPAEDEDKEADACTHDCTEDSGCVTRTLDCRHEHDDTCGYVPETPGADCTFSCRVCPLEELLAALPDSVTADNGEQVGEQLDEIFELYNTLTEEEQEQVDLSPCAALMDQLEELSTGELSDSSGSQYILTADEQTDITCVVANPLLCDTSSFTLTYIGKDSAAILVTETGDLELRGKVVSQNGVGVKVESGGSLTVVENTSISGSTYALYVAGGAHVQLSAGTYTSKLGYSPIYVEGGDYAALLAPGFAFSDANGNVLPPNSDLAKATTLTVGECSDHSRKTYTHTSGTPTHTWTCNYCATTDTEPCTFTFDEKGTGTCGQEGCGNGLAIVVDENDLSNLVYDGTLQPEEVGVTVTLTDGSGMELERGKDYKVDIQSITDAGQATVTVTGITFNGTFVKTYTVHQDKPGIKWDSPSYTVAYDGSAVTAGELPNITITIESDENLHPLLKYQYRKVGDTGFTDGLPTNAGTYQIKAYLEESQNYEAAETDTPLTLTIEKIASIVTPPAAATPTYNRAPQDLVTAGELNPVAITDGLELQFATEENGTYSTDIPTGIDAGEGYQVWYTVKVPDAVAGNYNDLSPDPTEVTGVKIQRKAVTPVVTLSEYTYLYDGGYKEPTVTVQDEDRETDLPDTEYKVEYVNNRNVSTDKNPAKVVVTDKIEDGGNYDITQVEVEFKITSKTQNTLSITNKPNTFTYGDKFTLGTSGGSGDGLVTWEITTGKDTVATVDANSGQVTITGHGSVTVKATKSGKDPNTGVVNYEDATAVWTFTAAQKPVSATVTADDKTYDGDNTARVHAVVQDGVLTGDEITITGLTGTFNDENAGVDKTVTVDTTTASISGKNSEHYAVTYSGTTVTATIHKAVAKITTAPVAANLTYDGKAHDLIGTAAVVDPADVPVEYALSETGPYAPAYPTGTNAGTYTVWYRVQETGNYTGLAPASVDVTIAKKTVSPVIKLSGDGLQTDNTATPPTYSYVYDGTAKEPLVTLYEADGTTLIPAGAYTVAYSGNVNVGTATVTVTAKADGNYSFENAPVAATFTIDKEQAKVLTAPKAAGLPLVFNTFAQELVTAGTAFGGTMVYRVGDMGDFESTIPTKTDAAEYTVYYKVQGDGNHSDSDVGSVKVTIAPKTVNPLTIDLFDENNAPLVSYTYDGNPKEPKVVVKDGSTVIDGTEYNIVYSDNTDAGRGTVNITDKPGGNYTVTGSTTFVINKADIVFNPAPSAATITYDGQSHELLNPGTTTGGTVLYALNSATSSYTDAIPKGTDAGSYNVYYKVTGDKNHNDLPMQAAITVTIQRKPLTTPTIELSPDSFKYDGAVHLPTVTVKDGDTVLPASEYTWTCNVASPTEGDTYTITVSDKAGGNYDLSGVTAPNNTATFTIGQAQQAELVIEGKPEHIYYGDTFELTTSGGSGTGSLSWDAVGGNADIDTDGNVTIKNVGEVTITLKKAGDTNYEEAQAQWTFTAAPRPVTASVTVNNKTYDGTIAATVASASITTINSDTVDIELSGFNATFDTPNVGTDKTVTLDTSKVQVTGDAPKYAISYPATVTADITQATTTIDTVPAAIDPLTYNGQPQALVTEGKANVGFLVYSLDGTDFSREIPTGTDAGTYTVYYKVDETDNYTGIAANTTPISVAIDPKTITPKIELSETSFLYDGTKKNPKVTVKDGDTVLDPDQYTATWDNDLTSAGTHTVTISEVSGKNYTFTKATASVEITPADQDALNITGKPEHVYYGDTITTLGTQGGTGNGSVTWKVTSSGNNADIDQVTGKLTITGTGSVTVRAERSVPNYGTVGDNWNFTVEPKPVTAEVTVASKTYDGTTAIADTAIKAQVEASDLVGSDTVALGGLTGVYTDPNAGTGKTVTLDSTKATADNTDKYAVSYPATAKGAITAKDVTVTVTLSDHDLKTDTSVTPNVYYEYDGTEKKPAVEVTGTEGAYSATLAASDFSVAYANNKNVGTATVTVKANAGGNYTFADKTVQFEIRSAAAVLTSSPQARDLTYNGTEQELVTVGTATGGTVVYALKMGDKEPADTAYLESIPKGKDAGTYTVYYKVKGDTNHGSTTPQQVTATIKPKEITPDITLAPGPYIYDGKEKKPDVTVEDGTDVIPGPGADKPEYSVSYRDNINAGTATVTVSNNNGGNYIVNGTASFTITKGAPTVTAPTGKTDLQYNGETQELVNAGVCSDGTVVYAVNGGNYSAAIPTASAVGDYTITWKVQGDANHSDTTPETLKVEIAQNTVNNPTITLSQDQFTYDGNQHRPTVTVYDNNSRLIPTHEYRVMIAPESSNMVDVGTYAVTIAATASSNYVFDGALTRTFEIVPADQETISITGTRAQVRYGDTIQLGVTGGTGSGTVTWNVAATDGKASITTGINNTGLLTVKDVNTSITVTVTRSRDNYTDVSDTWEFTAGKKPVTAEVTVAAKNWDGTTDVASTAITATVKPADLSFTGDSITGDSITITGLTGTYDNANVGTGKTVTLDKTNVKITGTNADKYDVTIPATATASILGVAAKVDKAPTANTLTYDASQAQALVTAGTATGGTMVYSLDGTEFTPNIPKGKDAGTYTVYYKAQGDQNHTDSATSTVEVTINQQNVAAVALKIELSPPSGQYDGKVQQPAVTVRDSANNVIPESEYKVTYVTDNGANWKDKGTYTVKVENITGGNYKIETAMETFTISTSAQAPLEIVNKPGLVYYGDTFTLSATGGSGNEKVTWSVDPAGIVEIDANGFVKVVGVGSATITATKAGGGNYEEAKATYPLNALKKPVTAVVTADDRVYVSGDTSATIHVTWEKGALVGNDTIDTTPLSGTFADDKVGTGKTVTITGTPVSDATAQKYDITIPGTTTASITKAVAEAPTVKANNRVYDGNTQALVTGGNSSTLYSTAKDGVYTANVPTGTNAGTYTVWYKAKGDENHTDSEPQTIEVTISPKTLTLTAANIELSGNDLKTDTRGSGTIYYYEYDGTEKEPSVVIKDGSSVIASSEYTVTYSDNKNVTTDDTKATVTITDNAGGNYTFTAATVNFEIWAGSAQLTSSPKANDLTYNGAPQQLVTVGTATGGHIEYRLHSNSDPQPDYSTNIPEGTKAGTYTVDYQVMGDDNHKDGPSGSVMVTIQPKTVVSPTITVIGGPFTYTGSAHVPTVTVVDGGVTIPDTEYTLSYQDNVNAGTATVIVSDNNGGDYTVNVTATFEIAKVAATVGTPPTGKTGLHYNGTAQELLDEKGTATGGTLVYSLSKTGEYSAAIPTEKAVGEYEIWYKVQGDANHSDSEATALSPKVEIAKNTVTTPTIQVTPASVKYTGEKQEPTVTVKDDNGLLIDGSEYKVTYLDEKNKNNADLIQVGTYTVTVTEVTNGNYTFESKADADAKPVTFTITPADQTALTITGTRERVYYGDTIQLGATGGVSGGTVTWGVGGSTIASIDGNTGLLEITGTGSVTVTATSTKTGYADQTATWQLYAEKKPVTALVTAASKTYNNSADAYVTATLQPSDFVGTDRFTITLTGCTFEDPNAGTDKKVNVVSTAPTFTVNAGGGTNCYENYAITYPATATASIFKADIEATDVTAPTAATGLEYTGLPQELVKTAGSAPGGIMEYSTDGKTYSTSLPTGTDAGDYDVWYRVKGDGNHNDTEGTKLGTQVTIAKQSVDADKLIIEFTPNGATYDGQEHKPAVTLKDGNARVIPDSEYTVSYGSTDWKSAGDHTVTIANKTDGNYNLPGTLDKTFTILPAGQSPLSIVGQPGTVQYGDVFTLSTTGGSGTEAVTWEISGENGVAEINGATGRVKILKAGGPVTITARKAAGGGYAETTATWTFSAEKRPATAIVTARNKPYDGDTTAKLDISWKAGDLLGNDSISLDLTGAFDNANVGENKIVRITRNGDLPDGGGKYAVTFNKTTTASITAAPATVSGVQSGPLTYNGSEQPLLSGGLATNGTIVYSRNGVDFMDTSPTEANAGKYTVYYKARGNTNYADSDVRMVEVTIQPKTVTGPTIELSSERFKYDGTAKEPDVVAVKDGNNVIPASEYTVSYRNNTAVGNATVTITDVPGGNYNVSGKTTFTITAGAPALTAAPQPKDLTYTGKAQALVTAGSAVNGKVMYSLAYDGTYSTAIPRETDAGDYEVYYKVVSTDGTTGTDPCDEPVEVTIAPKEVTPIIRLENRSSYSVAYDGSAKKPDVTVYVESKLYTGLYDYSYANNTNVGTAEVTVQSMGGNYQFLAFKTFEITKGKAGFSSPPTAKTNLAYNGTAQELVSVGTAQNGGIELYSLDGSTYSTAIPTAINRGSYTVYAKVQGSSNYEESDVVAVPVVIGVNTVQTPTVTLSSGSFPYTGSEVKPTVTVTDDSGNVIDSSEYTVTYTGNVDVGKATVNIKSKTGGNYSFTTTKTFEIVDASQTPLTITGKQDTVYYGDTLNLGATGGGSGAVTWSATGPVISLADGQYKVNSSGSVTITVTKGGSTDTWTFFAHPKPVTAVVTAANKVYDGKATATLTVTLSGLISGETIDTLTATGSFIDEKVGTNKTVIITELTIPSAVSEKYTITHNSTTTASITPKPASVADSDKPTLAGPLTYNGGAQALLTSGGAAASGNLMYSLDGRDYSYTIPTGTNVGTYTVWYKVEASDENHKDSAPVKLGTVTISANKDATSILCTPATIQYDGTEQTPTVVVRDSAKRIIPESEYTVTFEASSRVDVGTYKVTVTDKPGGNYEFASPVTKEDAFEIVPASQNPLSIVTDIPTNVHYGDTFRLSAMGGSGSGAVQWSIVGNESGTPATINANGVVTVTGIGGFTVEAYRVGLGGYSDSNTDSVPFEATPKAVTPVVTASDKPYDGKTDATLKASWKSGDLVNGDTIDISATTGTFATADAGTGKQVSVIGSAVGTDVILAKYAIIWPESTTASIYKVDAKIKTAPTGKTLNYTGSAQELVSAGTTANNIGKVEYSMDQNGAYSTDIPTGINAGTYRVWYKVADSVNYTGVAPAYVDVVIAPAASGSGTSDADSTSLTPSETPDQSSAVTTKNEDGSTTVVETGAGGTVTTTKTDQAGNKTETVANPDGSSVTTVEQADGTTATVNTDAEGKVAAEVALPQAVVTAAKEKAIVLPIPEVQAAASAGDAPVVTVHTGSTEPVKVLIPTTEAKPGTVAVIVKEDGTEEVVKSSVSTADGLAVTLTDGATVKLVDNSKTFTDIPAEGEAADAVAFASARELFTGTSEDTFSPDEPMTRAMMVTVLARFAGVDTTGGSTWYEKAAQWAKENGISSGSNLNSNITREQLAVMLWRYAGSPASTGGLDDFEDAGSVSGYAQEAMRWAVETGITGSRNGTLSPQGEATRAEVAQILKKFIESV